MANDRAAIPGSAAKPLEDAAAVPASEPIEATVVLRRNPEMPDIGERLLSGAFSPRSREEAAAYTQAAPEDVTAVENFAAQNGLQVVSADAGTRTVRLAGTAEQFDRAFGIELVHSGNFRSYRGTLSVPQSLAGVVAAVLGLDNRPVAASRQASWR